MRDYILKESKEFLPGLEIQIQEMDARLKISMCIEHKGNWQDSGRRWARRTAVSFCSVYHIIYVESRGFCDIHTQSNAALFLYE